MPTVIALVPLGTEDLPDTAGALTRVHGVTLLTHAVQGLLDSGCVDQVVVAGPQATQSSCEAALEPITGHRTVLVPGGEDHIESTRAAARFAAPRPDDIVLIHDPRRPFTPRETIRAVVEAVRGGAAAPAPVEPVTDTVKVVDADGTVRRTTDRERLRRIQAPRGFTAAYLHTTDLADALALSGGAVQAVPGHPHGMRIGTEFERTVAEAVFGELVGEGRV